MQSIYSQRVIKIYPYWGLGKTKPIKVNNQSSLITNQLEGKPNSPNVQMNLNNLTAMNYAIFFSLTKVKNKPNQTQFKANTKPILQRPKMNASIYHTLGYNNETAFRRQQNKPNQTQSPRVWLLTQHSLWRSYNIRTTGRHRPL